METPAYPEHDKLAAVMDRSQAIGEFLDSSDSHLCEWCPRSVERREGFYPVGRSINSILASHFGIDLEAVERERRMMLDQMRDSNARPS